MSIRLRMTLLYSTILALTLIVFSGVLYTIQSQYTLNLFKRDLALSAQRLALAWAMTRPAPGQDRYHSQPPGTDSAQGGSASSGSQAGFPEGALGELPARDTVRALNADGTVLDLPGSENSPDVPLDQAVTGQLQRGQPWIEIASTDEGRWLVYNQPVTINGQVVGLIQAARSLADRDRSLQGLGATLALGSLLTAVVAFGVGWVLSGMALQPIQRITQTAQQIGQERDFSSRVQYRGPNDELGQLAATFDAMLSRLQGAYQQVTHALQVQRDFVADVSHELRTPLTTIRGNLALLSHVPPIPPEERQDVLTDVVDETERLIRLVSDLLTLARMDAGRRFECEPVDVKLLAEDTCRQVSKLAPARVIECAGPGDAVALADRDALKQVLLILLDNGIKHAGGAIRVTVDHYDHQVAISVQDNGPGMSPELCERVFDRFSRGDASRSTPGFGLGLSIAKALVEAQQGTIAVYSQPGKGSTFTVLVPQAQVPLLP
jgi:two-component system OmpR family sensor kinase